MHYGSDAARRERLRRVATGTHRFAGGQVGGVMRSWLPRRRRWASLLAVVGDEEAAGLAVDRAARYAQQSADAAGEAEEVAQDTGGGFGLGGLLGAASILGGGAVAGAVGGTVAEIAEVALLTASEIMMSRATVENVEQEAAESRRDIGRSRPSGRERARAGERGGVGSAARGGRRPRGER